MIPLLGALTDLDDLDDHQPKTFGTLTRCEECMEMYPCSTIERAKELADVDVALLEMVDVGWQLAARYPVQMDPPPGRVSGVVVGYRDDSERGRVFTLVGALHGRPAVRELAARDVDTSMGGDSRPNSYYSVNAYRMLAGAVGKGRGIGDGNDVKYLAMALALAQAST